MKLFVLLASSGLLAAIISGCGGEKSAGPGSSPDSRAKSEIARRIAATVAFGMAHSVSGLEGDNDDDEVESKTTGAEPLGDNDNDNDNDVADNAGKPYFDQDDAVVSSFGHSASASERRALLRVVRRYYEAAAVADGAAACRLIYPAFARTIPEDYGQAPGPSYLRGAKTCAAVMSLLFAHERRLLSAAFEVTSVLVSGQEALVLLGSTVAPASVVIVRLWRGAWRVDELLGLPLQ
jgi:hypothetical protein